MSNSTTFAFECDECNSPVIMEDGYKEIKYSSDEYHLFCEDLADYGIALNAQGFFTNPGGFCYSCDLLVN